MSMHLFLTLTLLLLSCCCTLQQDCGDTEQAISCFPSPISLSFQREVLATSTCGLNGPTQYSVRRSPNEVECCQTCDGSLEMTSHPASYLTDLHVYTNVTSWISETGIYSPDTVNLTLSLPNRAELTSLSLEFVSYKPHSFYLEKSNDGGVTYDVMQYFSVDCIGRYQLDPDIDVLTDDQVVCEEIMSNRPQFVLYLPDQTGAMENEDRSELIESDSFIEFITFSHLRVVLDGHFIYNTSDPDSSDVDMAYYYEIADLTAIGRCVCNGHSSKCDADTLVCECEHNTQGSNCEECAPLYNDLPWRRGTPNISFQCQLCECNSRATSCYFDATVYAESNNTSGSVCTDCMYNTTGIHCEYCMDTFFINPDSSHRDEDTCLECNCTQIGVISNGVCAQSTGQCECKDNVVGRTCDACKPGYFNLSADNMAGCSPCNCSLFGSITANCDSTSGQCDCRDNTQSQNCSQCKPGYFNIMAGTMDGCRECECDVGGSTSPDCNPNTGECTCREGVTGRQCDTRADGYFVPLIDYVTLEGEDGNGTFSLRLLAAGENQEFTGTGYASLLPSDILTFQSSISVTTSGIYQLVIRYTLRSASSVSLNLRFDVNTNILSDGACTQQITTPTVLSIGDVTPASTSHTSVDVCLRSDIEYTVTLSHAATHSTILIDSLVLIPVSVLSTLAVFNISASLLAEYTRECVEPRRQLDTWNDIDSDFCNPITLSLSAELYNGLLPCVCYTGGATADNCSFEGQCSCLSGVGGDRICSQCMPGYHSFIAGEGCEACECVDSGSASGVCDFASGQCDCLSRVDGEKCDMCEIGAYNFTSGMGCSSCGCDILGSSDFQCEVAGDCICKSGVEGEKCDVCRDGYYGLGIDGCDSCDCNTRGVVVDISSCDADTGECLCKQNVEGRACGECTAGYFSLEAGNPTGCRACYCTGRSDTVCAAATGYVQDTVTTNFHNAIPAGLDGWTTLNSSGGEIFGYFPLTINGLPSIGLYPEVEYFSSPAKFLNFKLSSYSQPIYIRLSISTAPQTGAIFTCPPYTLVLRGLSLEIATCTQLNIPDSTGLVSLNVLLHETAGWVRTDTGGVVSEFEFLQVLSNLTALLIRGRYFPGTNTYFHQVSLPTAVRSESGTPVSWVESCACHPNYTGPSCSRCAPGYFRQPDGACNRCDCFGDTSQLSCDPNTGECIVCPPFTTGGSCESCVDGYYGSPSERVTCEPCACPGEGNNSFSTLCELIPSAFLPANTPRGLDIECTACLKGHTGIRCEFCEDNYYGDPVAGISCLPCFCSGNIDLNETGNCHNTTGVCLRCIDNTAGEYCEVCVAGYYGDATLSDNCTGCACDLQGANNDACNSRTGQCECRENIGGRRCDMCLPGYFGISSGTGCVECGCNVIGSSGIECNVTTGQCECLPGVIGLICDSCQQDYYRFSTTGCSPCNCFEPGSTVTQCDTEGVCSCREGVYGAKCDKCAENFYDVAQGCIACPECYQELQEMVNELRSEIENASVSIDDIESMHNAIPFTTRLDEAATLTNSLVDETAGLKADERSNIQLTHQLDYTARFLGEFITETCDSIEMMGNTISYIGNLAMSAAHLADATEVILLEVSDFLENEPRVYINQTQELMEILDGMIEVAMGMQTIATRHDEQADEMEVLIQRATNLTAEASYTIMRNYQQLITSVTPSIQNLTALLYDLYQSSESVSVVSMNQLEIAVNQLNQSYSLLLRAQTPNTNDGYNTTGIEYSLDVFQRQANDVSTQSYRLRNSILSLRVMIDTLFDNLIRYSEQILDLANEDYTLRENASEVYNESITVRDRSISLTETLNVTLIIISDFNKTSTEVKNDARESLEKVEQIRDLSKQAQMNASRVLREFSTAAEESNESYTNSVLAGSISTNTSDKLDEFTRFLTEISRELSNYTTFFNTTLQTVREYAGVADAQDSIMDQVVNESNTEADFCIGQAQAIDDLLIRTTNEITRLFEELNLTISSIQPPTFNIDLFEYSLIDLNDAITDADLENTVILLQDRLAEQTNTRLKDAEQLSDLRVDLKELITLEDSLPRSCNTGE